MPLAVVEQIAQVIESRLLAMVGDAVAYPIDVLEVIRPTQFGNFTPSDRQIILTQGQEQQVPELSCPGNPPAVALDRVFNIRCHVMQSEATTDQIDQILNQFQCDVIKAICTPASSWHNMGGNALMAQWGIAQPFTSTGGLEGVNLPLRVIYRVSEDDPTELR